MVLSDILPDSILAYVLVIIMTTVMIWVGSVWLENSAERLSSYYGVPPVIQGSIIVAMGSSFPELASVVITAVAGSFSLGVGAIVGSAIFNILVIPGLSGILSEENIETNRGIVYKEAQFYMIAVSALIIVFTFAALYYPTSGGTLIGVITRPMALILVLLYGLYIFIQWQDVDDYETAEDNFELNPKSTWGRLIAGLTIIFIAVEGLVWGVEGLIQTFDIPEFLAGVIIIASATSLPDTIISVKSAREGRGLTSLGNVLGSNTFDLLVVIPIGVLIVGAIPVDLTIAIPMFAVLTLATILLFVFLRTDMKISDTEAYILLLSYLVFMITLLMEILNIINFTNF